ncbi:thiamine-phosphate kinase [Desulfovibrio mangrovi]|uniref:thiamine-phosphate kinase n=1 Tax=Desulfovibrio mangrovi TaxID=2976983 RepID=UPI002245F587|nr:thiamine-phosphate kinase [Desulfovibrio mangrovi]UZP66428.1 thiamine-phosphate kinase [Desulfovibrio mangrovi]
MSRFTSEAAFLVCIDRHFPNKHPHMIRGRGDDCAVLACPERMSLSSDLFIEGVHFRCSYFSPADVGYKSLAVNLSDLAAAGAVPLGFSLGLMVPTGGGEEQAAASAQSGEGSASMGAEAYWDAFFEGMAELAREHNVALTGGDLSKSPMLGVSVSVWGGPAEAEGVAAPFLHRSVAQAGDCIFIVGEFGLARTGFMALESMGRDAENLYPAAVQAHLRPVPRVAEGQAIARFAAAKGESGRIGLMDISDGLARDLPRLIGADKESGLSVELEIPEEAVHEEVASYCLANDLHVLEQATLGGEDYALIGSCPAAWLDELCDAVPGVRVLGKVAEGEVHMLNGLPWEPKGFDHFG